MKKFDDTQTANHLAARPCISLRIPFRVTVSTASAETENVRNENTKRTLALIVDAEGPSYGRQGEAWLVGGVPRPPSIARQPSRPRYYMISISDHACPLDDGAPAWRQPRYIDAPFVRPRRRCYDRRSHVAVVFAVQRPRVTLRSSDKSTL